MKELQAFSMKGENISIIERICVSWEMVAYQLDFTAEHIRRIRRDTANHPDPSERACFVMLQHWLDRDSDTTWAHLLKAMKLSSESFRAISNGIEQALK